MGKLTINAEDARTIAGYSCNGLIKRIPNNVLIIKIENHLKSSIEIANAALESIRIDSLRGYGK